MVVEAKAGARVLPRYARILGVPQGRAQREASEAARACLAAMRFRFPEALYLVELVIRLGEVGAVDLAGSVSQIAKMIGEILGEPPPDPVRLQRALRALEEKTCLVKNVSRLRWRLCLAGISDPGSQRHRDLLKETPIPLRLGSAAEPSADRHDAKAGVDDLALRQRLEETVSRVREAEAERDAARAAQAHLEHQLRAAQADLERLTVEVEQFRGERDGAEDQRAAPDVVRDELTQRIRDQEMALAALRDQLAARDGEITAEREHRRLAEETRAREVAAVEDAMKAQAAASAECRKLEEAVLDGEIMLEDAGRQIAALHAEIERSEAGANERVQAAETAAVEDARKIAGLKMKLADERERRRTTDARLRRLSVALRAKLVGSESEVTEIDLQRDAVCLAEIHRVLEEHMNAKHDEREALAQEPDHDVEELDALDQDVRLGRTLGHLLAQLVDEEMARAER